MEKLITALIGFFALIQSSFGLEIPHFKEILDAQLKCDAAAYDKYPWIKTEGMEGLNTGTVAVITRPNLVEVPTKDLDEKNRQFYMKYTGYKYFRCGGSNPLEPHQITGLEREAYWQISVSSNPNKLDLVESAWGYKHPETLAFMQYPRYLWTDDDGLNCVVYIDELLKNPSIFPLDKICKGKSAKDKETTKKMLEKAIQTWKAAGVGK